MMIAINQPIKTQLKTDIINWFKENYKEGQIRRHILKDIVRALTHEIIHYKIYKKLGNGIKIKIIINLIRKDDLHFGYHFTCSGRYPSIYDLPVNYPIFIFIEFIQTIFDIIVGITKFNFFKIIFCTKNFIRTLFEL